MHGAPVLRNQKCPVSECVPLAGNLRNLQDGTCPHFQQGNFRWWILGTKRLRLLILVTVQNSYRQLLMRMKRSSDPRMCAVAYHSVVPSPKVSDLFCLLTSWGCFLSLGHWLICARLLAFVTVVVLQVSVCMLSVHRERHSFRSRVQSDVPFLF